MMIKIKWGKYVTSSQSPAFVSNAVIGKIFGIDGSSVQRLYTQRFKDLNRVGPITRRMRLQQDALPTRQRYGYRFLRPEHIDFLKDPETLLQWAGKSLDERCVLFHRHFGNHRINQTLLRQFYSIHKIKQKKIKLAKRINPDKEREFELWRLAIKQRVKELREQGYRIIYLDECFFTSRTMQMRDYSAQNNTHSIPIKQVDQPTFSLVLAVSGENGLEHYGIYKKGFDQNMFADYLDNLSVANRHHKIALFMDNVSSHKTSLIKMKLLELQIETIYNVPYQPDYNPAEACFSKIKNYYKRRKLNALLNEQQIDFKQLLHESVSVLNKEDVVNCVKLSNFLLNK